MKMEEPSVKRPGVLFAFLWALASQASRVSNKEESEYAFILESRQ